VVSVQVAAPIDGFRHSRQAQPAAPAGRTVRQHQSSWLKDMPQSRVPSPRDEPIERRRVAPGLAVPVKICDTREPTSAATTARKDGQMGKVVVMNSVSLDGVMQAPGRPDEDTRGGFAHGGWGVPYGDEATVAKMGERMGEDRAFLFGRRTYEQLLSSWNARGGPFKAALNDADKFVASSNPATRLEWPA